MYFQCELERIHAMFFFVYLLIYKSNSFYAPLVRTLYEWKKNPNFIQSEGSLVGVFFENVTRSDEIILFIVHVYM